MKSFYHLSFIFFIGHFTFAQQTVTGKVIDSLNRKPVPFATISVNKETGIISSESGQFTFYLPDSTKAHDSLYISCLGYQEKAMLLRDFNDSIIALKPKDIELDEIVLLNKDYTIDEIIARVKDSLEKNYDHNFLKQKLFVRSSYYTDIERKEAKLTKSSIPEFNQRFIDSLVNAVPSHSSHHSEVLGEFYGKIADENFQAKLDIIKASRLYDMNNEMSVKAITEKLQGIVKKRVKRDSYFKIKSGLIGTKTEIDSSFFGDGDNQQLKDAQAALEEQQKREKDRKERFLQFRKQAITRLQHKSFIFEGADLNFIHKDRKYEFQLENLTTLHDYTVYKVSFIPKYSADYKGTIYINADDFAIIRVDYENVKPLRRFSLLGVSLNQYLHKGTLLYEKNSRNKYILKYAEETEGQRVGFKRPVKIIEKNKHVKGRRKQNEIASDLNFVVRNTDKTEMIVFENTPIEEALFNSFKEKPDAVPQYLSKYDPAFWKGYNIIEPNEAIKKFKSTAD